MFNITLYQNLAENNRVDKTSYLTQISTISGTLRDSTSIIDIVIEIATPKVNFNYAYIAEFNRYYFVTDIVSIATGLWEVSLSVDVLMSYKDAILNTRAFVDRNEYYTNSDIIDERRIIKQGYNIEALYPSNSSQGTKLFRDTAFNGAYVISGIGLSALNEEE